MSQDLFAAFGDPLPTVQRPTQALHHETPQQLLPHDEDDDFGDFEDAMGAIHSGQSPAAAQQHASKPIVMPTESAKTPAKTNPLPFKSRTAVTGAKESQVGRHPFADHMDLLFSADEDEYDAGQDELGDLSNNPEAAMAYSKRVIQEQIDAEEAALRSDRSASMMAQVVPPITARAIVPSNGSTQSVPSVVPAVEAKPHGRQRDPGVLFDAEDLSDEPQESDVEEDNDWGDFEDTSVNVSRVVEPSHVPKIQHSMPSMDLLDLDDNPTQASLPSVITSDKVGLEAFNDLLSTRPVNAIQEDPWDDFDETRPVSSNKPKQNTQQLASLTPPTNIPPPSVLLACLGAMLKVVLDVEKVPAILLTAHVLVHVLAGRKLRWKRSSSLAASMRIGPAAAGGRSGMKLAGIDRSEVAKEDREAAETMTIWRTRVGKLRSAVTSRSKGLKIPDITETMPVKTLKQIDGALTAPHECALCGLRREERVPKVDEDIQDSFGEWWIENASMHTICAQWWIDNEQMLRSR